VRELENVMLRYQYNTEKGKDKRGKRNQNGPILVLCYLKRDQTYISRLLLEYWTLDSQSIQGERVNSNRKVWRSGKKSNKERKIFCWYVGLTLGREIILFLSEGARTQNIYLW
jgi:hypothetical protein